jgi:hypothetical protein
MDNKYLQAAAMNIRALSPMIRERKWGNIFDAAGGIVEVRGATGQLLYEAGMPFLEDLKYVPDAAFYASDVEDIVLPYGCNKIGNSAFVGCAKLKRVLIQGPISDLGRAPFSYSGIESFPFSHMDETNFQALRLPTGCFSNCHHLTEVTIPYGVVSIGRNCFEHCTRLIDVWLPRSVIIINDYAFARCDSLHTIRYGGNMSDWRKVQKKPHWKNTGVIGVKCIDGIIKEGEL